MCDICNGWPSTHVDRNSIIWMSTILCNNIYVWSNISEHIHSNQNHNMNQPSLPSDGIVSFKVLLVYLLKMRIWGDETKLQSDFELLLSQIKIVKQIWLFVLISFGVTIKSYKHFYQWLQYDIYQMIFYVF